MKPQSTPSVTKTEGCVNHPETRWGIAQVLAVFVAEVQTVFFETVPLCHTATRTLWISLVSYVNLRQLMSYFQFRSVGKWVGSAVMASLQDFEIQAVPLLKRSKMWNKNKLIETIRQYQTYQSHQVFSVHWGSTESNMSNDNPLIIHWCIPKYPKASGKVAASVRRLADTAAFRVHKPDQTQHVSSLHSHMI